VAKGETLAAGDLLVELKTAGASATAQPA